MINILIYEGKNGTRVDLKSDDFETMWCTQAQIAMLFDCSRNNVTEHIQKIFKEGELNENNTCRKFRHVSTNQEFLANCFR